MYSVAWFCLNKNVVGKSVCVWWVMILTSDVGIWVFSDYFCCGYIFKILVNLQKLVKLRKIIKIEVTNAIIIIKLIKYWKKKYVAKIFYQLQEGSKVEFNYGE